MGDGMTDAARMRRGSPSPERRSEKAAPSTKRREPPEGTSQPDSKKQRSIGRRPDQPVHYVANSTEDYESFSTGFMALTSDDPPTYYPVATVTTNAPMTEQQIHRTMTFLSQTFGISGAN